MYDAQNLTAEVEDAMKGLLGMIEDVEITERLSEVLDEQQIEKVRSAALRLSTAITIYVTKVILYVERNTHGTSIIVKTFLTGLDNVKNLFCTPDFEAERRKVDTAAKAYQMSMGFLTTKMVSHLLLYDKIEERRHLLNWLSNEEDISWPKQTNHPRKPVDNVAENIDLRYITENTNRFRYRHRYATSASSSHRPYLARSYILNLTVSNFIQVATTF